MEGNVKRNRLVEWNLTIFFFLLCFSAFVTPLIAQTQHQVWSQLQNQFTTANKDGFKQHTYIFQWLGMGMEPLLNWPFHLSAGSSYLIVGVCDNSCTDVDLAVEDKDRVVLASDTAADDLPIVRFTPSTTDTYYIRPTMHKCSVDPCGYGIGVFVKD